MHCKFARWAGGCGATWTSSAPTRPNTPTGPALACTRQPMPDQLHRVRALALRTDAPAPTAWPLPQLEQLLTD
eukprot:942648-Prymnesium_polylepis.1